MNGQAIDRAAMLPHGPAARLLTRVVETAAEAIVCEACVPLHSPYVREGRFPPFVAIEIAAQAAALLRPAADGRPPSGYVVLARDVRANCSGFPAGRTLAVRVQASGTAAPLLLFDFTLEDEKDGTASGQVGIWLEPA